MATPALLSHRSHCRQSMGIVGGELGVEMGMGLDQPPGAGKIAKIGGRLGGEDGIAGIAGHLGPLDLAIPIGALDQPHHQAAA